MATDENSNLEEVLEYRIFKYSSFSACFVPENILVDKPTDQTSRWSSANNDPNQFLTLKLQRPAIVKKITFGKYEQTHVCNMKKFKVLGGLEPDFMMELLVSGLNNDTTAQTLELKHVLGHEGNLFPCRYIKIIPIHSWGPNFNFSIWFVRLHGITNPKIVQTAIKWVDMYRQREVIRLCMKHFRRFEKPEIVHTLQGITGVSLEDPRLSILYDLLVNKGDYLQVESFMSDAAMSGLLNDYINAQTYKANWTKLSMSEPRPGMRGGHQMVLDPTAEMLYLFGGWDGNQDLSDLWVYNITANQWVRLCKDTESVGGPSARSCHKMILDPERRQIFSLGRYLDTQYRTPENLKSDFYVYDIESNKWTQISEDTGAVGGPQLIFDHQMSIDTEKRTIYVFGGRILVPTHFSENYTVPNPNPTEQIFSGFYSYHVPTCTWTRVAYDIVRESPSQVPTFKSRAGHSMLFHSDERKLYIFAGKRSKEYLRDFFTFNVDSHKINYINYNDVGEKDTDRLPAAGFTQRSTIDRDLNEIYVLSGLSKDKDERDDNVQNSFWVYNIKNNTWCCIYRNENFGEKYWTKMKDFEPCPRFAHQLVYDEIKKVHYLFGGNPGRSCLPNLRLDDFWQLKLRKPSHEQVLQSCKLIIRKYKFKELALNNSIEALIYLQTKVSEIIDHNDQEQQKEFQLLTSVLFRGQTSPLNETTDSNPTSSTISSNLINTNTDQCITKRKVHALRVELYDKLVEFFPNSLVQPRDNLMDMVSL